MKYNNVLDLIGNTPHVKLNKIFPERNIWIKLERYNLGSSIKDRVAFSMIEAAEKSGELKKGGVIIEPTSGNTGIGLSMVGAVKGYKVILVMPDSMSVERRKIMNLFGANFELTPKEKGMPGAIEKAKQLVATTENAWMPNQFQNPANPEIHKKTTAQEILKDFPEGLDYLICGVGSGGHLTGCSEVLKNKWPALKVIAVEPDTSPVLSGGAPGPHGVQGLGAGFIPENLDVKLIDEVVQVSTDASYKFALRLAKEEGILGGISTGALLAAISNKLLAFDPSSRILTFCYDSSERYLSQLSSPS